MLITIVWVGLAYLIGSISTAIVFCRLQGLPDPRTQGSGNPGTSNALRLYGKKAAIIVLMGDAVKGMLPVWGASLMGVPYLALAWIVFAAVLGHIFPVFFRFQGGKGVATAWGGLMALSTPLGLLLLATWIPVVTIWRYSSLGALITAILSPIYAIWLFGYSNAIPLILISALLIWRHKDNIQRLRTSTESKVNFDK
ncbi:MAG: glycerol-3-phosphate 1-O-acyltransferase PlsY [Gammaproteobacteria bacterium]